MTREICKTCGGIGEVTVDDENWHLATCADCLGTGREIGGPPETTRASSLDLAVQGIIEKMPIRENKIYIGDGWF